MYADPGLAKEVKQSGIGIQTAKAIKIGNALYRNILWHTFFAGFIHRSEFQSIVLSAHPAGIE
jgi:hypothetical protein